MPLGMEVGLSSGDFVFDGDPVNPRKKAHPPHPICSPCLLWQIGWMDDDATWYRNRPRPRSLCIRRFRAIRERGTAAPLFSAHFYSGQTGGFIKMPLGMQVGLSPGNFVLDGDLASPSPKGAEPPIFGPRLFWRNGCMDQHATWYGGRLGLRYIVLDGDPSPHPVMRHSPQFSANVRCGQTARWTKTPLGMEVGLGPGDFVFDRVPATPRKKGTPPRPNFWPMSIVAKRLDGSRCHLVRR